MGNKFLTGEKFWTETPETVKKNVTSSYPILDDYFNLQEGELKIVSKRGGDRLAIVYPLTDNRDNEFVGYCAYYLDRGEVLLLKPDEQDKFADVPEGYACNTRRGRVKIANLDGKKVLEYSLCYIK